MDNLNNVVDMAESAFSYSPIWQKRTKLGTEGSGIGYNFAGPPPDSGVSYGSWVDEANGFGVIAPISAESTMLYSPATGEPMRYEGPANPDMRDAVLSFRGEFQLLPASTSGHTCLTSAPIYAKPVPALFNPYTGEDLWEQYTMKTTKKPAQTPAVSASAQVAVAEGPQNSFKPKTITVPKVGQKEIPHSNDGTSMKPVSHSGVDKAKDGLNKATNPHGSDEPEKEKTVKQSQIKPAGDIKVPDVGMDKLPHASNAAAKAVEQMSDTELIAALEAHIATADGEDDMPKLSIELESGEPSAAPPPEAPPASPEMSLPPPPPPASPAPESAPVSPAPESLAPAASDLGMEDEMMPELGPDGQPMVSMEEPVIPVLEAPGAQGMPYASAQLVRKLRATAAALRAGVKVDSREQKALMAEAANALRASGPAAKQDLSTAVMESIKALTGTVAELTKQVATLSAGPAAVKAEEATSDDKKVEEIMEEDEKKEKAEGVHFEVLQSLDDIEKEGVTAAAVTCALFAQGGVNPFWNVTVHGEPLARIYLQDQERPDEIKALFSSPMYGEALAKASEQVEGGLRKLLKDANARFFTLQLDKSQVAKDAVAAATGGAKKMIEARLATLSEGFLEAMATAAIGMDRNFFTGGNPLKHAFSENLQKVGLPLPQAVELIEAAFSEGSADYFKALAKKATELMALEPVAFDQLRAAIIEAGTVRPVLDEEVTAAAGTMVRHLVDESNSIAGIQMTALGGTEQLSEKESLRRELGLGSSSFRR